VRNVSWSKYGEFLAFAVVLILIPGLDFAVVTKNTLAGGRRRGRWTALGVSSSNLAQGTAAAFGLSALIVKVQPLFESIKWAGVAYLAYLLVLVTGLHGARRLLMRQRVRRALDATTGAVLLGFGARLATEHV
jgi:threonine/homoserine/homoserine lactone efflux protein